MLHVIDDGVAASSSVRPDQFQLSAGTSTGRDQHVIHTLFRLGPDDTHSSVVVRASDS